MVKGFYLAGEFHKGSKPSFMILNQSQKPFKIDSLRGEIESQAISIFDKKRRYFFATHWRFIEGWSIEELNTIKELRETLNEIWAEWCSENNKKYFPLFDKLNEVSGNSFQD